MKAAVLEDWKTIKVSQVPAPELQPGEAILRVSMAGICGSDVHIYNGDNPIARAPVIPGHEFMGIITELAEQTSDLSVGDRVVVQPLRFCGECQPCRRGVPHVCEKLVVIGVNQDGGFAEYVNVPTDTLFRIPDSLPDAVAVLAEPFSIGYHACSRGSVQKDQNVGVIGGGPIGLYSAIVARELGAATVTISEPLKERRALIESFGITAIDPLAPDALNTFRSLSAGDGYDVVIESSGVDAGLDFASEATAIRGNIVSLGFPAKNYARYNITRGIIKEISLIGCRVCPRDEFRATLDMLQKLYDERTIDFGQIATQPRALEQLERSILDVESNQECAKILIRAE
ncbi:zinc-binding dehydrogenase [Ruegeria sp. HKCCD8929]|uniref:zinc-dependent alcohol dehydrogenase n=1 Tax=Ruegeria sp. HKCCD8929 TaxID=2683006 RepID=UPI001489DABE|nr:alcohol dehydrogenase catalytic domain-containing protein [Ruegeria sp. HKCCD8929]